MASTKRILEEYFVDQIIIPAQCHLLRDELRLAWLVVKAEFDESEIAIIDRLCQGLIAKELLVISIDIIKVVDAIPLPLLSNIFRVVAGDFNILDEESSTTVAHLGVQCIAQVRGVGPTRIDRLGLLYAQDKDNQHDR